MAKVLVALADVVQALQAVPKVDVGGESHIEASVLEGAIQKLTGTPGAFDRAVTQMGREMLSVPGGAVELTGIASIVDGAVELSDADARYLSEHGVLPPDDSAERARLAALPPGACRGCGQVHPHGPSLTGCADYVDTTVRDPKQARIERAPWGVAPGAAGIAPLPAVEPEVNPVRRPPANANEFRPPSG